MIRYSALFVWVIMNTAYADIYRWNDGRGNIHFSDRPEIGGEKMNIPAMQTPNSISSKPLVKKIAAKKRPHFYTKIAIVQPRKGATIRNNLGLIQVTAKIEPHLFAGDKVVLILDGVPMELQTELNFQLKGIYRGAHTLAIQIVNAQGIVLKTSTSKIVYVFRPQVRRLMRHS